MTILVLYILLTTYWWYLGAAADITYWIRNWLPEPVQRYLGCAACSGLMYGVLVASIGEWTGVVLYGLPTYVIIPMVGFASGAWTPLGAWLLVKALRGVHESLTVPTE